MKHHKTFLQSILEDSKLSLYGDSRHSKNTIAKFNRIGRRFDKIDLPDLLESWLDDQDIQDFTDFLKNKFYRNFKEYVIEYNIRSLCGQKAYSAVIIDAKEFGDSFGDNIYNCDHQLQDGSEYYLEQDLEGRRADEGNQNIIYDRAWIHSPREGKDFLRYLEANL